MKRTVAFLGDMLLNDEPVGIQRFEHELLRELDHMDLGFDCELIVPANKECTIRFNNIKVVPYGSIKNGLLWRQICFPAYVRKKKAISVDLTLGLIPAACDIVCFYDCIYEEYPKDFIGLKEKLKRFNYLVRAWLVSKKTKQLITDSNFSKQRLEKHYHKSDIAVIPGGWQHFERVQADESVLAAFHLEPGGYCFSLGSILPHKNVKWILAAALQNPECQFVITGTDRRSSYKNELDVQNIRNVVFTGFLPDGQIKALMQNCRAFLHPSLYEGFGIPPMEAMSCGAKCIVSNVTSLPEIYGDSVWYIDPHDASVDIRALLEKPVAPSEQVLSKYSWENSAKAILSAIWKVEGTC